MEQLLNQHVGRIEISGIRKFSNLVSEYSDALSLTIGQPDFPTPAHVKAAAKAAIDDNRTVYTPNAGLLELREAASAFVADRYGQLYNPADEVIVTLGASEGIDIALRTLLAEGTEVILPGPVYPGYGPLIELCGAKAVYADTRATGFKLTAENIAKHLTERTRCVILPYPSNPTGTVLGIEELRAIGDLLRDKPVFVISDEIYSELVYAGRHQSIATVPGMRDKTIVINGLSKSHAMTGWRIGFTFAPAYISRQMLKVHQYNVTCASSVSQYAAIEALVNGPDDALPMREAYRQRRDYVIDRLAAMGMELERPGGAFYLFPSVCNFGLSSFDFAYKLLAQGGVAVVPGDAFSPLGEGFVRISYAYAMDVLAEGCDRIERFVRSL